MTMNFRVEISGTDVVAYLSQWNGKWNCSLTQTYGIPELAQATPEQVARITFLLEAEYA